MRATLTFKLEQCCNICKHCDVNDNDDALIRLKERKTVDEEEWCEGFEVDEGIFNDCRFKPVLVTRC